MFDSSDSSVDGHPFNDVSTSDNGDEYNKGHIH